jgi:transposase
MTSHHYLSLEKKIELINDYAEGAGLSQRVLSDKYKISKGAVYNILQRKDEYKCDFQLNANKGVKRKLQDETGQKIDEEVFSWFVKQRSKNIPISGPLIQEKAREISEMIGISSG